MLGDGLGPAGLLGAGLVAALLGATGVALGVLLRRTISAVVVAMAIIWLPHLFASAWNELAVRCPLLVAILGVGWLTLVLGAAYLALRTRDP